MKQLVVIFIFFSTSLFSQVNKEEEITLKSKPADLHGTLLVPENYKQTVVLIIPGSGPTDRDGNSTIAGESNSLKFLAEDLAKKGYPSLRIDKRGVGKSMAAMGKEDDLLFDTYINDAIDWGFQILNDVRFKKLVVAGHSEGSLVGMVACQELDAAGFISLAGVGFPIDSIITKQMESQPDSIKNEMAFIFEQLKQGKEVKEISVELLSLFRPSIQPYFISWLKYNPALEIAKLSIPILIVNGTTDLQVGIENAEKLNKANPTSKLAIIDGMNHVLKAAPEEREENFKTYSNPELQNVPQLNKIVIDFLTSI